MNLWKGRQLLFYQTIKINKYLDFLTSVMIYENAIVWKHMYIKKIEVNRISMSKEFYINFYSKS